jgi:hypothetical protein
MKIYIAVITTEDGATYTIPFEHSPCKKDIKTAFNDIGDCPWHDVCDWYIDEEETIK